LPEHTLVVTLDFASEAHARAVQASLAPEVTEPIQRSWTAVTLQGRRVSIDIRAEDISSLRASLNSNLRLADEAARIAQRARPA